MNERIEAYDGANQEGQWVYDSQGVASDQGFGHVSKDWYPKTISYDQGMELLEAEQGHRQDYLVPVSELEFGIEDVDGKPRFVVSVAKDYQGQGLPLTDLINEGNLGLIKAAERFDETRGFKFISYAVWWIRQSILQALAEHSRIVRLPLNRVGTISKITKAAENLESEYQRPPNEDEIGKQLEMQGEEVTDAIRISRRHHSLHAPFRDGDKNTERSGTGRDQNVFRHRPGLCPDAQ